MDGDGKIETVIITADKVIVFRYDQQRFQQVYEYAGGGQGINIGVDVADINGNGVPKSSSPAWPWPAKPWQSFALEYDGKTFNRIVDNAPGISGSATFPTAVRFSSARSPVLGSP